MAQVMAGAPGMRHTRAEGRVGGRAADLAPGDELVAGGLAQQSPQLAEEGWDPWAGEGRRRLQGRLRSRRRLRRQQRLLLLLLLHCRSGASGASVREGAQPDRPGPAPHPPPRMRGGPAARARAGPAPPPRALHNVPTCAALTCHNSAGTGGTEPIGARLTAGGGAASRGRTFPAGQRRVAGAGCLGRASLPLLFRVPGKGG